MGGPVDDAFDPDLDDYIVDPDYDVWDDNDDLQHVLSEESFNYDPKTKHEKYCSFVACSCPVRDCNVKGSSKMIYGHCKEMHKHSFIPFHFGRRFGVSLNLDDRGLLLQEDTSYTVFVVNNTTFHSSTKNFQDANNFYSSLTELLLDSSDRDFFPDGLVKMEFCKLRIYKLVFL
ncbi:uncharacterized protein LOC126668585 [Mercurialis annua]|uniref:uncharacterized protein LOC126668585 n=1 Tax=Mercurialis annua TaxID=3986 RepID=UPI00215DDDD9|nr:uncharacterized protein LOC126668585 [Mercurialis annua]